MVPPEPVVPAGEKARGLGDDTVGLRVPLLAHAAGMEVADVRLCDRVRYALPPYRNPREEDTLERARRLGGNVSAGAANLHFQQECLRAAGGTEADCARYASCSAGRPRGRRCVRCSSTGATRTWMPQPCSSPSRASRAERLNLMKTFLLHSLLLALLFPLSVTAQAPPAPEAQRHYPLSTLHPARLHVGTHTLRVWLMDTDGKREEGMMFLLPKDVAADEGMLFLFGNPQPLIFWMRNTRIPLDIAYISADLHIINVVQGKALDETLLPSRGPAQFVLEVKAGTLQKLGIRAGMSVRVTALKAQGPQVNSRKAR